MKKIIAFIFSLVSITVLAQNNAADTTSKSAITEAGKPDGKITEMKINKDGGTLVSGDGNLELIIPAGALSKKTTISIQPVTNMVPNGNGQAYRLEPSGIQFQQPVQLIFHYTDEESADSMQSLMGIAMQDNNGQWFSLKKFTLDTVAKTISGNINHFSTWATFEQLKLITVPDKKRIKVKNSIVLIISGVTMDSDGDDELASLDNWKAPIKGIWRVNGVIKGNAVFGKLVDGIIDESKPAVNNYTAPANVPDQNPVAISVDLVGASFKNKGITFKNLKLVYNILVYDNAYEITMVSTVDGSAGSVLGKITYRDEGSFVVSLNGKDTKIIEKVNKNIPDKLDYKGNCIVTPLKPGSGNIHITGVQTIIVTPATPAQSATVEIVFKHAQIILPLLHFDCPPIGKGGRYAGTNAQANAMIAAMTPAYPQHIKFRVPDDESPRVFFVLGEEFGDLYVKFTIQKIKDD
jgi:hypothetical protein